MLRKVRASRFLLPLLAIFLLLSPLIVGGRILAYRDSLHFYYPLWHYLDGRPWSNWLLPQFNFFDRHGSSIVGEPTSLSFYPLRILLRLPGQSLEQCIGIFLATHLVIAWFAVYFMSRRVWHRGTASASMAASAYTFGGSIFFSIYNPPYLISSAWLPIAFGSMWMLLSTKLSPKHNWRWSLAMIASITLMIFGGDVQTPYNLGIIAGLVALLQWKRSQLSSLLRIGFCFVAAAGMAAVQIIPTWHWMHVGATDQVISRGNSDLFTLQSIDMMTWFAPLCLGSYVPNHTRWSVELIDGAVWCPSLHIGLIFVAFLACGAALYRIRRLRLLGCIALFGILCAAGTRAEIYRILSFLLPVYDQFRFPMKWFPIAALALCLIGAAAIDLARFDQRIRVALKRGLLLLAIVNSLIAIVCGLGFFKVIDFNSLAVRSEAFSGAFDEFSCIQLVGLSSMFFAISAALTWIVFRSKNKKWNTKLKLFDVLALVQLFVSAWLVVSTIDMGALFGNGLSVVAADTDVIERSPVVLGYHRIETPEQIARRQREMKTGKLHLLDHVRSFNAQLSIEPHIYRKPLQDDLRRELYQHSSEINLRLFYDRFIVERKSKSASTEVFELPILDDGGWSITKVTAIENTIPSETCELLPSPNHLLSIRLPSMVQDVTLSYSTPGMRLGMWITAVTFVLLIIITIRIYV
jgi:hypothetical protein